MILSRAERMLVRRYLLPHKGEGFIFVVAGFSVGAVALGVWALVVVMSVMNGFRAELFDKIVGLNGHAIIQGYNGQLHDWERIVVAAKKTPGVTSALPLIEQPLYTDRIDLLIKEIDRLVNISRGGQLVIPGIVEAHLERVEYDKKLGIFKFYPFVRERSASEPKFIVINPALGFGKPVVAGTGVSTAVIASRFNARESIPELAKEYGLEEKQIEEAIRWETRAVAA